MVLPAQRLGEDTELESGAEESLVLKKSNEERELALLEEELGSEYRNCRSCFRVGSPFRQIVHEAENIKASAETRQKDGLKHLTRVAGAIKTSPGNDVYFFD